jgi:hypothetical protein
MSNITEANWLTLQGFCQVRVYLRLVKNTLRHYSIYIDDGLSINQAISFMITTYRCYIYTDIALLYINTCRRYQILHRQHHIDSYNLDIHGKKKTQII